VRHASRGHGGVGPVLAIPETAFPVRRLMPLYSPILAGDPVLANASWTSTLCVPLSIQRLAGLTRVRGRFLMRGLGTGACGGLPANCPSWTTVPPGHPHLQGVWLLGGEGRYHEARRARRGS